MSDFYWKMLGDQKERFSQEKIKSINLLINLKKTKQKQPSN